MARTAPGIPQSGTRVTVMYSSTDHIFFDCSTGKSITWETVSSDNLGVDWNSPVNVTSTQNYDWCSANDQIVNSIRDFSFTEDPGTGDYWAAVHDQPNQIGVFRGTDFGDRWTRVHTFTAVGRDVFQPNIAVDANGAVSVSYFKTDSTLNLIGRFAFGQINGRTSPTTGWSFDTMISSAFFTPDAGQNVQGGDYQALVAVPSGALSAAPAATFFNAWSQSGTIQTAPVAVLP